MRIALRRRRDMGGSLTASKSRGFRSSAARQLLRRSSSCVPVLPLVLMLLLLCWSQQQQPPLLRSAEGAFFFAAAAFVPARTAAAAARAAYASKSASSAPFRVGCPTAIASSSSGRGRRSTVGAPSSRLLGLRLGANARMTTDSDSESTPIDSSPMAFSSGFSTLPDLNEAVREAVAMAVSGLPPRRPQEGGPDRDIDVGWVSVTSLYDGGIRSPATALIPALLESLQNDHHRHIDHIIGSSTAGCISSVPTTTTTTGDGTSDPFEAGSSSSAAAACQPVELDGIPAVSVTLAVLPDVSVDSFVVASSDVPDGNFPQYLTASEWRRAVGLSSKIVSPRELEQRANDNPSEDVDSGPVVFYLLPSPAFATDLDSLVSGMEHYYPSCQVVGGVASTVSSLSRAKLYQWSRARNGMGASKQANKDGNDDTSGSPGKQQQSFTCVTDGCVGLALKGDVAIRQMMALGAKPVGGIYQVLKASGSTISVIVLDEVATEALQLPSSEKDEEEEKEEEKEEEDDAGSDGDGDDAAANARQQMAQFYAKAQIPKPVLAEANFLMRTLSDDDQAFMRRQLLVGLEQGGGLGRTASELARLAAGQGHRFAIHPVASAGMKDGSVTLPLGSVNVQPGTRLRFFVREADFAKKEVTALWAGYMKRALDDQFKTQRENDGSPMEAFKPAACFIIPTLDRGSKFFLGKPGYEGSTAARLLPGITSISGFFANGVVGRIEGVVPPPAAGPTSAIAAASSALYKTGVQGSASGYILWGSRTGRPVYSPAQAAADAAAQKEAKAAEEREAKLLAAEDARRVLLSAQRSSGSSLLLEDRAAPRSEDGELILKRREVHSGRALTVSTVEWSVAEKIAKPSSALEGFMWEKETEVDRFRERVPLSNLVSQCRQSSTDPTAPKPRDWIGPVMRAVSSRGFAIIPECKRMEPTTGSLRRRYDVSKLAREFTLAGVPALSVNCDAVLFGGTLEDVTRARQAASSAAVEKQVSSSLDDDGVVVPPILASDLLLYPYQLYKLRLAGADAVNLVAGALARKDLVYLTKIASSLQLQTLISVTSHVQIRALLDLPVGSFHGLIVSNRELEDFAFDMTGEQALDLLKGDALVELRAKVGHDFPVLVEGRVGIIERPDPSGTKSAKRYLEELKEAGAVGAIVGGGLATSGLAADGALESLALPLATS